MAEPPILKPGYLVANRKGELYFVAQGEELDFLELICVVTGDCVCTSEDGIIFGGYGYWNIHKVYGFVEPNNGYSRFKTENRPLLWSSGEDQADKRKYVDTKMIKEVFGENIHIIL